MTKTTVGRTFGTLRLRDEKFLMKLEPHAALWAKRIFQRIPARKMGEFWLSNTPAVCRDLVWFESRFRLSMKPIVRAAMEEGASEHADRVAGLDRLIDRRYKPRAFDLAIKARTYQNRAAELWLSAGGLLLADDVGLGKTVTAIAGLTDPRTLPALVVCLAHLPKQWEREINRFAPSLETHVIKAGTPYELPRMLGRGPDVLIISYHKLKGWRQVLSAYCRSVIFDEVQELRHSGTEKSAAASEIAEAAAFRLGLSATPIYNYGGEIFNVMRVLTPGALGSDGEFFQEWCQGRHDKARVTDPDALGSWMRENHLMIRRTRRDVRRELPALQKITHVVEHDTEAIQSIEGRAGELARLILSETRGARGEAMQAAEEFSMLLRQATGIDKAPYVAEFVRLLLENGEHVVLFGWHRAVYEIWGEKLKAYRPAFYTGSESPAQKQRSVDRFLGKSSGCEADDQPTPLLILSLRSGAGLDGLQKRSRTVVFGELDWSPGVHEQCIGRVHRDGQPDPVTAYFLVSESGIDPIVSEICGVKSDQVEGLRGRNTDTLLQRDDSSELLRTLAETYLKKSPSP